MTRAGPLGRQVWGAGWRPCRRRHCPPFYFPHCTACVILVPQPGIKPTLPAPLHWEGRVLTLEPQGKSQECFLYPALWLFLFESLLLRVFIPSGWPWQKQQIILGCRRCFLNCGGQNIYTRISWAKLQALPQASWIKTSGSLSWFHKLPGKFWSCSKFSTGGTCVTVKAGRAVTEWARPVCPAFAYCICFLWLL